MTNPERERAPLAGRHVRISSPRASRRKARSASSRAGESRESVPLHLHSDDMESWYVLEGKLRLYIGEQPGVRDGRLVRPYTRWDRPPSRVESERARHLILTTPRDEEFYRAITLASRPGGLPPLESIEGLRIKHRPARSTGSSASDHCPTNVNHGRPGNTPNSWRIAAVPTGSVSCGPCVAFSSR